MQTEKLYKRLINIQNTIDQLNIEALKREFDAKLRDYEKLKESLEERNSLVEDIDGFWEEVIMNSEMAEDLLEDCSGSPSSTPLEEVDGSWIGSLRVEYRPNFKYYVSLIPKTNEYFSNEFLEKEFSLFENKDCIYTTITWKEKKTLDNRLINFFSSDDSSDDDYNVNMFQILCDLYVNAVYYYMRCDEEEEMEDKEKQEEEAQEEVEK